MPLHLKREAFNVVSNSDIFDACFFFFLFSVALWFGCVLMEWKWWFFYSLQTSQTYGFTAKTSALLITNARIGLQGVDHYTFYDFISTYFIQLINKYMTHAKGTCTHTCTVSWSWAHSGCDVCVEHRGLLGYSCSPWRCVSTCCVGHKICSSQQFQLVMTGISEYICWPLPASGPECCVFI